MLIIDYFKKSVRIFNENLTYQIKFFGTCTIIIKIQARIAVF